MDSTYAPFAPTTPTLHSDIAALTLCLLITAAVCSAGCCTTAHQRYDLDKRVWVEQRLTPAEQLRGNLNLLGYAAARLWESLHPARRSQEVRP